MPEFIFTEDEPSDNSSLWKFLNKDKFLSMILNQKLHLTRLDVFDDNNEGISANQILFERYSEYLIDSIPELNEARENGFSIEIGSSKIDSFAQELELFQKSNFANCWFISEDGQESAAMWNLFSSPNSAALKIKYKEFKKNLVESGLSKRVNIQKLIFGKVKYLDFFNIEEILAEIDKKNFGFIKERSYAYENEFRILGMCEYLERPIEKYKTGISKKLYGESFDKLYYPKGKEIYLENFAQYPFTVVMHPKSQDWASNDIREILSNLKYNCNFTIENSKLKMT